MVLACPNRIVSHPDLKQTIAMAGLQLRPSTCSTQHKIFYLPPLAEAAAEVEADERRERRRRRPHAEDSESVEEVVARRGVGEIDMGWLTPGWAASW